MATNFLTAEWRKLLMINYAVDKKILDPYLPKGTELDTWNNICYISLVGFMFQDVQIKGFKIPFHTNFEEVNLRFYVKSFQDGVWKRGVVFIKEIVPKPAITFVANTIYKENYQTLNMKHRWEELNHELLTSYSVLKKKWYELQIKTNKHPKAIIPGSEAEFITEHYWGYAKINENETNEYQVKHPIWEVYDTLEYMVNVDFKDLYGDEFDFLNNQKPLSAFLAEGSPVVVNEGRKLNLENINPNRLF
jgi:uncharacterized protein YqjF (DUF2071 family)